MKKFTTICFCMLLSAVMYAQIPNNDFENWFVPSGQSYQDPVGWQTTNDLLVTSGSDTVNVFKDATDFYHGASAVKMVTKSVTFGGVYTESVTGGMVEGNMVLNIPVLNFSGGFPFTGQPGVLTGYYKYTKAGSDSYSIEVLLTKRNGSVRDTVAVGYLAAGDNESSYVPFSLNLYYKNLTEAPDTAFIAFFSSAGIIGTAGSTLWIDDISFGGTAGTNDVKNADVVSVFPNPAQSAIYINAVPGQFNQATIYDITGRLVKTKVVRGNSIDVNDLANGNYIMMLNDRHNNLSKALITINR